MLAEFYTTFFKTCTINNIFEKYVQKNQNFVKEWRAFDINTNVDLW